MNFLNVKTNKLIDLYLPFIYRFTGATGEVGDMGRDGYDGFKGRDGRRGSPGAPGVQVGYFKTKRN